MPVACFGGSDNRGVGVPLGMTERFDTPSDTTSTTNADSESADVLQAAPGATGSKDSTGAHTAQIGQLIALAPPSSNCPADTVKANGTACTADTNVCTTDVCNGTVGAPACTHPAGN